MSIRPTSFDVVPERDAVRDEEGGPRGPAPKQPAPPGPSSIAPAGQKQHPPVEANRPPPGVKISYRRNVACCIVDPAGRILMCERRAHDGWQFVQGGIEHADDDVVLAAAREIHEEVGLHAAAATGEGNSAAAAAGKLLLESLVEADERIDAGRRLLPKFVVHYLGSLPLLPEEAPMLKYDFPAGACKKWIRRGIVGQQQQILLFGASDPDALMRCVDLRGRAGARREFIRVVWHPLTSENARQRLMQMVPQCKAHIFEIVVRALQRCIPPLVAARQEEEKKRNNKKTSGNNPEEGTTTETPPPAQSSSSTTAAPPSLGVDIGLVGLQFTRTMALSG